MCLSLDFSASSSLMRASSLTLRPPILGFPVVEGRIADAVLATNVSDLQSLLLFVEGRDDLRFAESWFFHDWK